MANLFIISDKIAERVIVQKLGSSLTKHQITPYRLSSQHTVDWSDEAIGNYVHAHLSDIGVLIVDYDERSSAQVARNTGYTGPIVGIVTHRDDTVPGATVNFLCGTSDVDGSLEETIDALL